ncbi:MAG: PD-(D/E)XK nuclease family protein [Bacilli bacterium]|nr:PD-(D/E)XK nuclease family protein [Bacilli bacterium]
MKNKTMYIVPNHIKKNIIEKINNYQTLVQYKVISIEEFLKNYLFDYEEEALYKIVKEFNLLVPTAKEYLDNLIYIEDKTYNNKKLDLMVTIKNYLKDNNLIKENFLFKELLKEYKIEVYYQNLDPFIKNILNKLDDISFIDNNKLIEKELIINKFKYINDEVFYIAEEICNLLKKDINISQIKLCNISSEYINPINRIFPLFNLKVKFKETISLYETDLGLEFLNLVKDSNDFEEIITFIEKKDNTEDLINIINKYYTWNISPKELYNIIEYDLKSTKIKQKTYINQIEEISIDEIEEDQYVFIMGFNNENIPKTFKDDGFLTDNLRKVLNLNTIEDINKYERIRVANSLFKSNNIIISLKENTPFKEYRDSSLIEELNMKINYHDEKFSNYSEKYNKILLSEKLDDYIKYSTKDNLLELLYNNYYNSESYFSYDNRFKGIDKEVLRKNIDNTLKLSYSTMDDYYRCKFKYYLNNILKLNVFESTFKTQIGEIFHYALSNKDKNPILSFEEKVKESNLDIKGNFYIKKLEEELPFILDVIKEQKELSTFDKELYEQKIEIEISDVPIKIIFKGIIDKLMYKEEVNTLISIIDYKTGTIHSDLSNTIHGISMQLPVYLYLVKKSNMFTNPKIVGFYLQKIIHQEYKINPKKTYDEQRKDDMKLIGYSTDNMENLEKFDKSFVNSEMIKSMKLKTDGTFTSYSKVITDDQIEELIKVVEDKIKEAATGIINADFSINPKIISNENEGCKYCNYRDICFKTPKDFIELQKENKLSFLGGEENADLD